MSDSIFSNAASEFVYIRTYARWLDEHKRRERWPETVARYVAFIKKHRGLILYHSTGSGKTITAIKAMCQFKNPIVVIGAKSSNKAFTDDIKKLKLDQIEFVFYTFAKIKRILKEEHEDFSKICVEIRPEKN